LAGSGAAEGSFPEIETLPGGWEARSKWDHGPAVHPCGSGWRNVFPQRIAILRYCIGNMKSGLFQFIKRAFSSQPEIHPIERGMAKRWIKQRLVAVFPELRNNPPALERAYRTLGLQAREGQESGEAETVFELTAPGE